MNWKSFVAGLAVSLVGLQSPTCRAEDQAQTNSIEELTSILQAIDPYHPTEELAGEFAVTGSTIMDAMAHGWLSGFSQFHPKAKVVISSTGSNGAFERLIAEPSTVAMISRPVTEEELAELKSKGLKQPAAFVVAREALGVFTHNNNPVDSITGEQLRQIFTSSDGKEVTWGDIGATGDWAEKPVHLVARFADSGTQQFLAQFVFKSSTLRDGQATAESNSEVVKAIGSDPLSIGICGLRCQTNSQTKALHLTAGSAIIPSDDSTILSGKYPLTRPLTLVIDLGQTSDAAKASQEFVRYAMCQAGQSQAILAGFFPIDLPLLRASVDRLSGASVH